MYGFVDESGNTGRNLFDAAQPIFTTLAVMTQQDFDKVKAEPMAKLAALVGAKELHAGELGVDCIEKISPGLLSILKSAQARFAFSRVEKRYLLASKIFDSLFDHGENEGAYAHIYMVRPLRLMTMFKLAEILTEKVMQDFWKAIMAKKPADSTAGLVQFCDDVVGLLKDVTDKRFVQIIKETLTWARDNPEAIYFHNDGKLARQGHMPNTVGFGNLMGGIEAQSKLWGSPIEVIRHDEQDEFSRALRFWHEMYANASPEAVEITVGEKFVMQKGYGSKLEMTSSENSPGIQATDVLLWLFNRMSAKKPIGDKGWKLLRWALRKSAQIDFSFEGVSMAAQRRFGWMMEVEPHAENLERAKDLLEGFNVRRKQRVLDYAERKTLTLA